MTQKSRTAFNRLQRLGYPVFETQGITTPATAQFYMSAEQAGPNDLPCCFYNLDMFRNAEMPGVDPKVTDVLNAAGLHPEWQNAAVLNIYLT